MHLTVFIIAHIACSYSVYAHHTHLWTVKHNIMVQRTHTCTYTDTHVCLFFSCCFKLFSAVQCVIQLLEHKADIHKTAQNGGTPLYFACRYADQCVCVCVCVQVCVCMYMCVCVFVHAVRIRFLTICQLEMKMCFIISIINLSRSQQRGYMYVCVC